MRPHSISTKAVHAGDVPDGPLASPLVLANAFAFENAEAAAAACVSPAGEGVYSRWSNPTVRAFEEKMIALENAADAVALSSGMAAIDGVLATLLSSESHVVAPTAIYAETARVLRGRFARFGVQTSFVDMTDEHAVRRALRSTTRVIWAETPANPTLAITNLASLAEVARSVGAHFVVDNTFATPIHQQPLALGADLVVHAATKAIGGHGDAMGGVVVGSRELVLRIRDEAVRGAGAVLSPFNAWLLARGVATLPLRMKQASATAHELAVRLEGHASVERVFYPGLVSHPGHDIARHQMRGGFGALVAFTVRGGFEAARRTYDRVQLVSRAVSLGDVKTLITHAASTTHASMNPEQRIAAEIEDGSMRLSVGIEDVEDLWQDLARALQI